MDKNIVQKHVKKTECKKEKMCVFETSAKKCGNHVERNKCGKRKMRQHK